VRFRGRNPTFLVEAADLIVEAQEEPVAPRGQPRAGCAAAELDRPHLSSR
jgi:hypothetical protein